MKVRRILTLTGAMLFGALVLIFDIVRTTVAFDFGPIQVVREIVILAAFVLLFLFLEASDRTRIESSVRNLGLILVASIVVALATTAIAQVGDQVGFEAKEGGLIPLNYGSVFLAAFVSLSFGVLTLLIFRFLRDLVLYKRKRGTRRNLFILIGLMIATSLSTFSLDPLDSTVLTSILFGCSVVAMLVNSFRLSWIVYLSKREKVFSLVYAFLLFGVLTFLNIMTQTGVTNRLLLYNSYPLREFIGQTLLFGNIYAGMAFVSTLFHLPTAEAFEKKTTEISSLHNLGKLITRVFDFDELVDSVTAMTLQVCEANVCWLEIVNDPGGPGKEGKGQVFRHTSGGRAYSLSLVGNRNITTDEICRMLPYGEETLRDVLIKERKPMVVDDMTRDDRIRPIPGRKRGSMVVVPLLSHAELVGILYAFKDTEHGFFKDDIDVISAFADQATIAIENSRLIDKSIEKERLSREMLLAREMQKRLLPQTLPSHPAMQLDAVSTPAYEVGGDYYDVATLDGGNIGIVVGDVSGKGVSAAFYMSEVKGIFQALSRMHPSPREFILKANEVLAGSIDRRSFVSLIYAVVNPVTGLLTLSRAGHCPMLHVRADGVQYIRPSGMGLGLSSGDEFTRTIEETTIQLQPGDVCLFYTDGLTEARNGTVEFGYERLVNCARHVRPSDAGGIKESILDTVREFTLDEPPHDDLTLVVLKWHGHESPKGMIS